MQQQPFSIKGSGLGFQQLKRHQEQYPWFLIQPGDKRVYYRHDWITDFLGEQEKKQGGQPQGGLGLSFIYPEYIEPGTFLQIGIPLPESIQDYQGEVILINENEHGYEIGIWLYTSSDADLELLLRSCEYVS